MIITADNLLSRLKLDCDEGYNVAVKGPSVIVIGVNNNHHKLWVG
jgi:hypothetical protein